LYLTLLWLLSLRCWRWLNLTLPSLLLSRRWRGRLHLTLLRRGRLYLTLLWLLSLRCWRWLNLTLPSLLLSRRWLGRSLRRLFLFLLFLICLRRLRNHKHAIEWRGVR
jgi:hypothetical protein